MALKIAFICFLFLFIPSKVFASDVAINEVYANPPNEANEFIELFNNTSADIVITGWKISDKVGSPYTLPATTLSANGYLVLKKGTTGIALNNSGGEEVTLKNSSDQIIDSFSYDDTISGKSWSRVPNGSGSFANNTDVTEGAANATPPTSTPTEAPTATKTPTPTKEPTSTPSPSPTKGPTSTPIPTKTALTPTKELPSPTGDPNSDLKLADSSNSDVFGKNPSDSSDEAEVLGASTSSTPFLFIVLGLIFLSVCGILTYLQFGDKILPLLKRNKSEG